MKVEIYSYRNKHQCHMTVWTSRGCFETDNGGKEWYYTTGLLEEGSKALEHTVRTLSAPRKVIGALNKAYKEYFKGPEIKAREPEREAIIDLLYDMGDKLTFITSKGRRVFKGKTGWVDGCTGRPVTVYHQFFTGPDLNVSDFEAALVRVEYARDMGWDIYRAAVDEQA